MAEEILVKEPLTENMIADGAALTRKLDEWGWPMVAAFWYFETEANDWKLMISSAKVNEGPRKAYELIGQALDALPGTSIKLHSTTLVAPDHPLVRTLASAIQPGPDSMGIQIRRRSINGRYVEDAYLYRLKATSAAA
jgi:hypothetical protein